MTIDTKLTVMLVLQIFSMIFSYQAGYYKGRATEILYQIKKANDMQGMQK